MAVSLNDFLLNYYSQLHFDRMPPEVRARFDDYVKRGDLKGNMKSWTKNHLQHQPAPNEDQLFVDANGDYVNNPLPNPNDPNNGLDQDDWEKLFNIFNSTLGRMARDTDGLADTPQAKSFVEEYYGPHKLFALEPVTNAAAITEIAKLKNDLHFFKTFLPDDVSFDKFRQDLLANKYDTDGKFRHTFCEFIEKLERAKSWGMQEGDAKDKLKNIDIDAILKGFEQKPAPGKLTSFKLEYGSILNRLHDKTKLREMFSKYDEGKISGQLTKALGKVNYDDKSADNKSYVHPKTKDELNLFQQVKEWISETYEDHLENLIKLRGNRMFFSEPAQMICKAIDKVDKPKITPTDGIAAVLNRAEDIKKNMQYKSPTTNDHFDWFVKEMNVLKDAMPKAFDGALKNGPQLRRLIEKLITDAVEQNKVKEAKTAMEILSVIKYANTTSAIMDKLKSDKELFNIFSNKDLSWNKNAGVQFVTSALDKSVRAAFIGIGYGATMAINGIRKARSKINTPGKLITKAHDDWQARTNREHVETQQINQDSTARKQQQWQNVHNARRRGDIETDVANWTSGFQPLDNNIKTGLENLDQFVLQQTGGFATQDPDLLAIQQYVQDVQQYMQATQNPPVNNQNPPQIPNVPTLNGTGQGWQQVVNTINQSLPNWVTQYQGLKTKQDELNNLNTAISELRAANEQIKQTNAKLATWDDDHKDQYDELIKHWNRLETGRDSHMGEMYHWGFGSAKKAQEEFWRQNGGRGM